MTPVDVLRQATQLELTTEDGDTDSLELEPGLSTTEIAALEQRLPCDLPSDIRELLEWCAAPGNSLIREVVVRG